MKLVIVIWNLLLWDKKLLLWDLKKSFIEGKFIIVLKRWDFYKKKKIIIMNNEVVSMRKNECFFCMMLNVSV